MTMKIPKMEIGLMKIVKKWFFLVKCGNQL